MSDPHTDHSAPSASTASTTASATTTAPVSAADLPLISPVSSPSSPLVRIGGFFGIAGSVIGLILLIAGCAGVSKALAGSVVPVAAGAMGLVITLLGALAQRRRIGEDTHVLQALFACIMSTAGGLLEMAVWMRWPIFK